MGGSEIYDCETFYLKMLKAIVDFTIPDSTCNVFYNNKNGIIKG